MAFGTDFSKDKYVQDLCGPDDLLTLLDLALEGMLQQLRNPLIPVSISLSCGNYKACILITLYPISTLDSLVGISTLMLLLNYVKLEKKCIKNRIQAIKNGEDIPQDILTQIITLTQNEDGTDIEDLVDDFATFYAAGNSKVCVSVF